MLHHNHNTRCLCFCWLCCDESSGRLYMNWITTSHPCLIFKGRVFISVFIHCVLYVRSGLAWKWKGIEDLRKYGRIKENGRVKSSEIRSVWVSSSALETAHNRCRSSGQRRRKCWGKCAGDWNNFFHLAVHYLLIEIIVLSVSMCDCMWHADGRSL